jgi:hypothetical protein
MEIGVQIVEEMMNLDLKLCARTQMVDHTFALVLNSLPLGPPMFQI